MFTSPSSRQFRRRSPAGTNTNVQFNKSNQMAGDANLTWNTANSMLTVGNTTSLGAPSVSSSTLMIGNSSINCTANSTALAYGTATVVNSGSFTNTGATTNGTYVLPNGYRMAWGLVTAANATGGNGVTFATAFTTNAFSITTTHLGSATIARLAVVNAVTKTGFSLFAFVANSTGSAFTANSTAISGGVYWQAFGS